MPDTSLAAVNNDKKAHAEAIIAKAEELRAVIQAQPDLWFGGLPPVLTQMDHFLNHHITVTRSTFGLEAPAETEA